MRSTMHQTFGSILIAILIFNLVLISSQQSMPEEIHDDALAARASSDLENVIRNYFDKQLREDDDHDDVTNEYVPIREKKSRSRAIENENSPILSHGRKSFENSANIEETLCASRMVAETNRMIDSKASVDNGAKFLQVEKIKSKSVSKASLKELNEACTALCCANDEGCDTALLSLKLGDEGYRCYQFKCASHCIFIKHSDYVVLAPKSADQLPNDDMTITTGQNQNNDLFNTESMYDASEKYPNVRIMFEDNDKSMLNSASLTTTAIILLIFGVSLILGFFTYLLLSTKFMNKKVKWLSNLKNNSKNVDVDEDYLINGMYL